MKPNDNDCDHVPAEEERSGELLIQPDDHNLTRPQILELLPMVELNIFPQLVYPISVEDPRARAAVKRAQETDRPLALFAVRDVQTDPERLTLPDFYPVGLVAQVHKTWEAENGNLKVVVQGLCRARLLGLREDRSALVESVADIPGDPEKLRPLVLEAKRLFGQVAEMSSEVLFNPVRFNGNLEDKPGLLADLMMAALPLKRADKTAFLGLLEVEARLTRLLEHLTLELANLEAGRAIAARMKANLDQHHREMHLREQLKAIEAELGEDEGGEDDYARLAERLRAKALTEEAREAAERELSRLKKTSAQSSEYGVIRNYLEWILDLPWLESTFDQRDLPRAREILERDHYGLEKVKKRLVEFLAVRQLTGGAKSPILCLVGPPGVGKTSLGRSVAEALGREFVRLSLGGVRDEAEIRGHRRTYVGALPGRLLGGLKKAKSNNPVFLLDELDKMTMGLQGDPAAALLEVLDPEQNSTFSDHYLEIPFDLSQVLFILTANVLENIPGPLRDRLEVVEVNGYTLEEKVEIAKRHLWPKELERHGLTDADLVLKDDVWPELAEAYTREAGVRDLTRRLGDLARSLAVDKAEGRAETRTLGREDLGAILGPPRHRKEIKGAAPQMGVVTGLAWTAAGGDILFIEAVAMPGQGQLCLTGQLGEVMQESARAAVSYVRSRALEWGLEADWFKTHDLHVHLPQGAIPKDGPSAGVTLATAIVSLARGRKVRPEVAMTGEISLRGLILPIGGLKEKLLAAKRAGLTTVLIPDQNKPDLEELPGHLLAGLTIIPVKTLDEALEIALVSDEPDWTSVRLPHTEDIFPGFPAFPAAHPAPGGLTLAAA